MGFFSGLFATPETMGKAVDAVISAGDKLIYTDEEKSDAMAKYREWYLKYLEASAPQNRARRLVALVVTGLWAFLIVATAAVSFFDEKLSHFLYSLLDGQVNFSFLTVLAFYFGHGIAGKFIGKNNGKVE